MREAIPLITAISCIFLLGAISALILYPALSPALELPTGPQRPEERHSPGDTVTEDQIKVYKNGVYVSLQDQDENDWLINLDLADSSWSTFTDTNSMDPVFDVGANTVRIRVPPETLQIGDIVSYRRGDDIIIHRITHIDQDEQGLYFVLKGDNNPVSDPGKVRPEQILGKVVAIFY
ncbi:signal peptidase I [Candidatus Woesearchaeota archaeon]|nr:signal peptidase I [Candidatus Woesearchaeota archaeon]